MGFCGEWGMGNGANVRVWKDKWLPPPYSTPIYSPHQRLDVDAKVGALMDPATGEWNIPLIQETFTVEDAGCILSLISSSLQAPDTMIWQATPHGIFTVRSVYYLEQIKRKQGK
jgi:hypothetical protein